MKSTRVLIRAKGRGLCIERGLYDCLQKELFADVTLKCEGVKIRANKGVLAAASPVLCHLLKDWPATEDPCVIMAGYTEEEVQGLVRYIYTGQLSAPRIHGSSWEKIIGDFKVGSPLESDDDLASIHELTDYGDSSPVHEPTPNGVSQYLQQPFYSMPARPLIKGVGPKIVAVTSPRPLIVQVQSLTQPQTTHQGFDCSSIDAKDTPNGEMTNEDEMEEALSDIAVSPIVAKRKRPSKKPVSKRPPKPKHDDRITPTLNVPVITKKLPAKRAKHSSKFARKKYVCPHCSRRFLTRGNVKNHMRSHSRDKPFQCPVCQDLFAYQAVYQRHLVKHNCKSEIGDSELEPMIAESLKLADEIGEREKKTFIDEDNDDGEETNTRHTDQQNTDTFIDGEEDDNAELMEEEEAKIALKMISASKIAGSSKITTDNCNDLDIVNKDTKEYDSTGNDESEDKVPQKTEHDSSTKDKQDIKESKEQPKSRMNFQVIECDFCPMKYHKWSAFYIHRCSHTGELPVIPCGVCEKEFPNIKALKAHKTTEHRESVFQCDDCERNFLSKSALVLHQAVHSTSLNYQCRYCSEKMRTVKERYLHEKGHNITDETSFQCSHCQKNFTSLVNLRSHLKTHSKAADSSPV